MRWSLLLPVSLALTSLTVGARAQEHSQHDDRDLSRGMMRDLFDVESDRAALGISTSSSGKRDTLGLLIVSITPGGPAEKAGLEEGNRIAAIKGVSLALSRADAGEPDMEGLMTRRLVRELRKVKAGDEVELKVYANGAHKTVKAKTTEFGDLRPRLSRRAADRDEDRAVLGLDFGGRGSKRDTLGILVVGVEPNGPAEKAGIEEGNRVATINGADLRVPAEEAAEGYLSWSKQDRFRRQMQKVKPGDTVELKVYADGQMKTVRVKAARAGDVYTERSRHGLHFRMFGDEAFIPLPPIPPIPPIPPMRTELGDEENMIQLRGEEREAARAMRDAARELRDAQRASQVQLRTVGLGPVALDGPNVTSAGLDDDLSTLSLPGLRITEMSDELAPYFCAGSGKGLLVLEADEQWSGLRPGDVILKVNGASVRRASALSTRLDSDRDNKLEVLRKGKRVNVVVRGG
jgi:serine protease Do